MKIFLFREESLLNNFKYQGKRISVQDKTTSWEKSEDFLFLGGTTFMVCS